MFWLLKSYRHVTPTPGLLAIGGLVDRPALGLTFDDLVALPEHHQVRNIGAFAGAARVEGAPLQGVRIQAIQEAVGMLPEAIIMNIRNHAGFVATLFRRELDALAIVAYARAGRPLAREDGGPFRLVLPGLHDETGDVHDLAVIEFTDQTGPDSRGARSGPPAKSARAGDLPGLPGASQDPADPRTLVMPAPRARSTESGDFR